jgi:hypothetical protein
MNSIVSFRKCTLTDDELLKKVDYITDQIYISREIPSRHIPARPNDDYDLLIGELILRFNERNILPSPGDEVFLHWKGAMVRYFKDEFYEVAGVQGEMRHINSDDLDNISNNAAIKFLNLLIK